MQKISPLLTKVCLLTLSSALLFLTTRLYALEQKASDSFNSRASTFQIQKGAGKKVFPVLYDSLDDRASPLIKSLKNWFSQKEPSLSPLYLDLRQLTDAQIEQSLASPPHCAVTIGLSSTRRALAARTRSKIFSLLVSKEQLDGLARTYQQLGLFVSGIYEEQSFIRQLYLAQILGTIPVKAIILLDQKNRFYLPELLEIATNESVSLKYKILRRPESPNDFIDALADKNDYFLIQNQTSFSGDAKMANLVLSAYRNKVRLIGNRASDTIAGALASVYTPANVLAQQAVTEVGELCEQKKLAPPHYARRFAVNFNSKIADNLGLPRIKTESLTQHLNLMDKDKQQGLNNE